MADRILLIGGTGVFGTRLAHHLACNPAIDLTISSRSEGKAKALADKLGDRVTGVALDTNGNLKQALKSIKPFAVVDCSGPFQKSNFETARAVINAGAHWVDLADARDYLIGFAKELDAAARSKGVTALAGASSTPALSGAVVRSLTQNWKTVYTVDIYITPGGRSNVGRAVLEAILSYAGKDVSAWQNGQLTHVKGWLNSSRVKIPHLGFRRVAPVETADAELLGPALPKVDRINFCAGLESAVEQWGLQALAQLRSRDWLPDPNPLIPALLALRKITRIPTSDSGGMLVVATGLDSNDQPVRARWSLLAKNDHGPNVPILATAAAVKRFLSSDLRPGARIASENLALEEIEAEMRPYDITCQTQACPG